MNTGWLSSTSIKWKNPDTDPDNGSGDGGDKKPPKTGGTEDLDGGDS